MILARPKSVIRGIGASGSSPRWSRMLDGLRSRWRTPRSCACWTASARPAIRRAAARGDGSGPLPQPGRERGALAIGRDDVGERPDLARLEDGDDLGMVEPGRGPPLAEESTPRVGRHQDFGAGDLQRHVAAQRRIASQVDDPEAPLSDLPDHLEPAQDRRDRRCIGDDRPRRSVVLQAPDQGDEARQFGNGRIRGIDDVRRSRLPMARSTLRLERVGGHQGGQQALVDRRDLIAGHVRAPAVPAGGSAPGPRASAPRRARSPAAPRSRRTSGGRGGASR